MNENIYIKKNQFILKIDLFKSTKIYIKLLADIGMYVYIYKI